MRSPPPKKRHACHRQIVIQKESEVGSAQPEHHIVQDSSTPQRHLHAENIFLCVNLRMTTTTTTKSSSGERMRIGKEPSATAKIAEMVLAGALALEAVALFWAFGTQWRVDPEFWIQMLNGDVAAAWEGAAQRGRSLESEAHSYLEIQALGIPFHVLVIIMTLMTAIAIKVVEAVSGFVGVVVSRWTVRAGMVVRKEDSGYASPLDNPIVLGKFQGHCWMLVIHVGMSIWEWQLFSDVHPEGNYFSQGTLDLGWYTNADTVQLPPGWSVRQPTDSVVLFYAAQLAVWFYTGFACLVLEERRKDFFVMMAHHVVTICLVMFSACFGYMGTGIMVLYVHDVSDIFVDLLKLTNYLDLDSPRSFYATEIVYLIAIFAWLVIRLGILPLVTVPAAVFGSPKWVPSQQNILDAGVPSRDSLHLWDDTLTLAYLGWHHVPGWPPLAAMLLSLQVMHVWWFVLLLNVGLRAFTVSRSEGSKGYEGTEHEEEERREAQRLANEKTAGKTKTH